MNKNKFFLTILLLISTAKTSSDNKKFSENAQTEAKISEIQATEKKTYNEKQVELLYASEIIKANKITNEKEKEESIKKIKEDKKYTYIINKKDLYTEQELNNLKTDLENLYKNLLTMDKLVIHVGNQWKKYTVILAIASVSIFAIYKYFNTNDDDSDDNDEIDE